jgi:hypothetical protein
LIHLKSFCLCYTTYSIQRHEGCCSMGDAEWESRCMDLSNSSRVTSWRTSIAFPSLCRHLFQLLFFFFIIIHFLFWLVFGVSSSLLDLYFGRKTCHPSLWISLSWHCWSSYTAYAFREHIMDSFVLPFPSKCTCLGYIFFSYLCSATTATKLHFRVKMWPV